MYKVQLTLTPEETHLLQMRANHLGYSVTRYIKLLIGKEALEVADDYPTIALSDKAIKTIEQAHKDHKAGKSIRLESVDDLDQL